MLVVETGLSFERRGDGVVTFGNFHLLTISTRNFPRYESSVICLFKIYLLNKKGAVALKFD